MKFRWYRIVIVSIWGLFIPFLIFAQSIKDEIASGNIPLPSDAKVFSSSINMGQRLGNKVVIYSTAMDRDQLIAFYGRELSKRGWQSKGSLDNLFKNYVLPINKEAVKNFDYKKALKDMFYFYKNDSMLTFIIMPSSLPNRRTFFSLSMIKSAMDYDKLFSKKEPLPGSIPVYPNSTLVISSNGNCVYTTDDTVRKAAYFYKRRMSAYGWRLEGESPPQDTLIDTSDCKVCQQLSQALAAQPQAQVPKVYRTMAAMEFSKDSGEKCYIRISGLKGNMTSVSTQINIRYVK